MKPDIEKMLGIAADSSHFGCISDTLSFMTDSVRKRTLSRSFNVISDDDLAMVAGGVALDNAGAELKGEF